MTEESSTKDASSMIRACVVSLLAAMALCAIPSALPAQGSGPCHVLSYWNRSGTEYVHTQNLPTDWFAIRMTPADEADVDTAYIGFGIVKNNTPTQYDSLEVRILNNTLPTVTQLDRFKAAIPANFNGEIPDDYWVVEFWFDNNAARITPVRDFLLVYRLVGPSADVGRIRMVKPSTDSGRSIVVLANGTSQTLANYLASSSMRDTVDLMAETRVCYYNVPVELASLRADYVDGCGILQWTTASETQNFGFEVQRVGSRSADGRMTLWQTIGFVNGHGSTTAQQEYRFIDRSPLDAADERGTVRYRLRQIDYDGGVHSSPLCEMTIPSAVSGLALGESWPSPATGRLAMVSFSLPDTRSVRFEITDMLGRVVATVPEQIMERGRHTASLPLVGLSPGMYQYTIVAGSARLSRRLSVIR